MVEDGVRRRRLEADLASILTGDVLAHLPPPLQLDEDGSGIPAWVDARAREGDVLLAQMSESGDLVGLMILACVSETGDIPSVHIGYLLVTSTWGQGIATELVAGLVAEMERHRPVRLIGGVDKGNPASARVLEKAGFVVDPDLSHGGVEMYVRILD